MIDIQNRTQVEIGNYPADPDYDWIFKIFRDKGYNTLSISDQAWLWGLARITWPYSENPGSSNGQESAL